MRESSRNMARRSSDSPAFLPPAAIERPDFRLEAECCAAGARLVAGVDEVGRGPLAGPVVAAAVILDPDDIPKGLNDSKKLKPAERERLFGEILARSLVSLASVSAAEIDRIDIRQATLLAMRQALAGLAEAPDHVLVDGLDVPPFLPFPGTAVVRGDARSLSIAAASIVAKVMRDRIMTRMGEAFPVYGFSRHMGYGTARHLDAIARHGPCPHHRRSFRPMRQNVLTSA